MKAKLTDIFIGSRRRKEMGDVADLAKDFTENGQITPITVRPPTDEERELGIKEPWILVAGGRRYGAAMMAGWSTIEIFAREEMSEIQHRVIELNENLKRKEMTWQEVSDAKREIFELRRLLNPTITQAEVARELQESPATFSRDVAAAEAMERDPSVRSAASRKGALRIAKLTDEFKARKERNATTPSFKSDAEELEENIVTADAREWLAARPPRSADLCFTDPPFGMDYWKAGHKKTGEANEGMSSYDDSPEEAIRLITDIVPLMVRATRETGWIISFMGHDFFADYEQLFRDCCATHAAYRKQGTSMCLGAKVPGECNFLVPELIPWIWYRPNSRNNPRYADLHAKNMYEKILVVNMGKGRLNGRYENILVHDADYGEERIHANQKPLPLAQDIVQRVTIIGDTVIDPCFGSGRLLTGAASKGRRVAGCDLNAKMREPAIALTQRHLIPAPRREAVNEERRQKLAAAAVIGVTDFSEVPDVETSLDE
jgi:ParB/RepB/Spo0J family partition protein